VAAGFLSGGVAGQYARLTGLALSGQMSQVGKVLFRPQDLLLDSVLGGAFAGIGYGLGRIIGQGSGEVSTDAFLEEVARRAENRIGGTGRVAGTLKHSYASRMITHYQNMFGQVGGGLESEQSYYNGGIVNWGRRGSVRLDVVEGDLQLPAAVYDFKFGVSGLSQGRINRILSVGRFPPNTPVIEIRP
jgi:hypothetical protein